MLNLKYPAISSFFAGLLTTSQTLGNRYLSEIAKCPTLLNNPDLIFTQRIPNGDFFSELQRLEGPLFKENMENFSQTLAEELRSVTKHGCLSCFSNLRSFHLRAGWDLSSNENHADPSASYSSILREFSIGRADSAAAISKLVSIFEKSESLHIRASIANRIIVMASRGEVNVGLESYDSFLQDAEKKLLAMKDPNSLVLASMIQRGRPMLPTYGPIQKLELVLQSLDTLGSIEGLDVASEIALREIKLTSMLTLAKTLELNGQLAESAHCFAEMSSLDPFDSVVASELGLFFYRHSEHKKALEQFSSASLLGPPGVSMNLFFEGLCLLALGDKQLSARSFLRSSEADDLAVSPLLELLKLGRENLIDFDLQAVVERLRFEALWDQLDEGERAFVHEFAKID